MMLQALLIGLVLRNVSAELSEIENHCRLHILESPRWCIRRAFQKVLQEHNPSMAHQTGLSGVAQSVVNAELDGRGPAMCQGLTELGISNYLYSIFEVRPGSAPLVVKDVLSPHKSSETSQFLNPAGIPKPEADFGVAWVKKETHIRFVFIFASYGKSSVRAVRETRRLRDEQRQAEKESLRQREVDRLAEEAMAVTQAAAERVAAFKSVRPGYERTILGLLLNIEQTFPEFNYSCSRKRLDSLTEKCNARQETKSDVERAYKRVMMAVHPDRAKNPTPIVKALHGPLMCALSGAMDRYQK